MAKVWGRMSEYYNTKQRVWLDSDEYWSYLYINKQTGRMYVMVAPHYYEPIEEHTIREWEDKASGRKEAI